MSGLYFWHTPGMHHRRGIASICLFALFTASCGGGGGSTPEESRVDDVVAFLEGNGTDGNGMELPEAETRCVAESLVAGLDSDLLTRFSPATSMKILLQAQRPSFSTRCLAVRPCSNS